MSRVQLALRVADLEGSIAFYRSLFGVEPAKRRPGYANFAVTDPPLKLVLIEGDAGEPTVMDHLGVEVGTTEEVDRATGRLSALGLFTRTEEDTTCCYALQDKVWVHAPGAEPWEVYTVKADAPEATSVHPAGTPGGAAGRCECGRTAGGAGSAGTCCTTAAHQGDPAG
ncbi:MULTISPECIES: ArsI/CadI family heavy metal resistance metalloenzyme [unclassified Pseudonocardia]|uniref:ArsI/CadI family heavy metal resistance metalloenzyme n=1 Tax=unclassified Pseudonocardia TaxID=2619320 RepID=UPI0001FFED50|nr:ArsI/CadI family heavy metal resistance metalloenzyme [Pseudonocardia sp. Ae707_Ps1]OLM19927.1 Lactoylglutathione lyase [Pseudonocardia sp. Ae707_Ps1]